MDLSVEGALVREVGRLGQRHDAPHGQRVSRWQGRAAERIGDAAARLTADTAHAEMRAQRQRRGDPGRCGFGDGQVRRTGDLEWKGEAGRRAVSSDSYSTDGRGDSHFGISISVRISVVSAVD